MKKIITVFSVLFTVFLSCPVGTCAAESSEAVSKASAVPIWLCIPFAGLLLCIAIMPLIKAAWWEGHQPLIVVLWIIALIIPFVYVYGAGQATETVLECLVDDYLTFIILLFGLFCVSGIFTM